ncbi:MAG: hypothetical protein Q4F66_11765 [Clostridium sp.]|nr:hypothetical protein [Clostridium sp.]
MQENCIKIHRGTKESRSLIEIQSYITQLEMINNKLKKKLIQIETLSQRYESLVSDYKRVREELEQVNIEIAYYQSLAISKNNGRPAKLSTQQVYEIRELRKKGETLKRIANQYQVSTALVHKVTKDVETDSRKKIENECLIANDIRMD